jgi:amino acid transporter
MISIGNIQQSFSDLNKETPLKFGEDIGVFIGLLLMIIFFVSIIHYHFSQLYFQLNSTDKLYRRYLLKTFSIVLSICLIFFILYLLSGLTALSFNWFIDYVKVMGGVLFMIASIIVTFFDIKNFRKPKSKILEDIDISGFNKKEEY